MGSLKVPGLVQERPGPGHGHWGHCSTRETLNKMTCDEFIYVVPGHIGKLVLTERSPPPLCSKNSSSSRTTMLDVSIYPKGGSDGEAQPGMTAKSIVSPASQIPFI